MCLQHQSLGPHTRTSQIKLMLASSPMRCPHRLNNVSATCWRGVLPCAAPNVQSRCTAIRARNKDSATTPSSTAGLENASQKMLVQLLGQVMAERDEAQAKLKICNDELEELKHTRYLVDPGFHPPRVDRKVWEERIGHVVSKWEAREDNEEWTADNFHWNYSNYDKYLMYDEDKKCFYMLHDEDFVYRRIDMHQVMSSALLLYRVCCLFDGIYINVDGRSGYKTIWAAEVIHKATGEVLRFSEWKASAAVYVSNLEAPAEFENDMVELINLLFDAEMPHPYDGTVAGSVA